MTNLETALGKDIHEQGLALIEWQSETFGDPKIALWRKTAISKLILEFAGVSQGAPFTPRVHAAMKLGEVAVAILGAKDPGAVIADAMATLVTLAPVEQLHGEMEQEQAPVAVSMPKAAQLNHGAIEAVRNALGGGDNGA